MCQTKRGASADDKYDSPWFAYNHLLFIGDSITPRSTKDSLEDTIAEEVKVEFEDIENNVGDEDQTPEIEVPEPSSSSFNIKRKLLPPPQTCRGVKRKTDDDRKKEEQAFGFLEVAAKSLAKKDDCSTFGEMVAVQIRKFTPCNQAIARNRIQNFIFDLEMQEINNSSQSNTVAPQYYSPSGPSSESSYGAHNKSTIITVPRNSRENSAHPSNIFGKVQQFLCFNLDDNKE